MTIGPVWQIGCGNMGGAMLRRWVASGMLDPARVTVIDPGAPAVPNGVAVVAEAGAAGDPPTAIVLAVKPQQLAGAADAIRAALPDPPVLLISILAGVEEASLRDRFGAATVVRAMPNLPVGIGKGVVALHGSGDVERWRHDIDALMAPLGLVEWLDKEALFDAVTALSGSGPAFLYRFAEALAAGGVVLGLAPDQADRLARATVEGAAIQAAESGQALRTMADAVASPGGSTREGLDVLDANAVLGRLVATTLAAARDRNRELAEAAR